MEMLRIGLVFPLFCSVTLILLIPGYVSASELEEENIFYEEIYGSVSIIDDVIHEDKTILIGLKINLKEGWNTYWRHSGNTGLPTVIDIEKIPDMEDFKIFWPKPEVQESDGNISLIYKNEIVIPILIQLTNNNSPYSFELNADFGVCKEICIPVKKNITFSIKRPKISSRNNALVNALSKVPESSFDSNSGDLGCLLNTNAGKFLLEFSAPLFDPFFESWAVLEYDTDMITLLKTKKHISDQKLFFEIEIDRSKKKYLLIDKSKFKLTVISKDKSLLFLGCH